MKNTYYNDNSYAIKIKALKNYVPASGNTEFWATISVTLCPNVILASAIAVQDDKQFGGGTGP